MFHVRGDSLYSINIYLFLVQIAQLLFGSECFFFLPEHRNGDYSASQTGSVNFVHLGRKKRKKTFFFQFTFID